MSDFFNLKNINIAYLIIDGDDEDSSKKDIFLKNETNNILLFEDKFQTFISKIRTYFVDMNNFMAMGHENDGFNNYNKGN